MTVIILFTSAKWGMKIIQNIVTVNDFINLDNVIGNGKMHPCIHLDGYRGIYCGKKKWSAVTGFIF